MIVNVRVLSPFDYRYGNSTQLVSSGDLLTYDLEKSGDVVELLHVTGDYSPYREFLAIENGHDEVETLRKSRESGVSIWDPIMPEPDLTWYDPVGFDAESITTFPETIDPVPNYFYHDPDGLMRNSKVSAPEVLETVEFVDPEDSEDPTTTPPPTDDEVELEEAKVVRNSELTSLTWQSIKKLAEAFEPPILWVTGEKERVIAEIMEREFPEEA